MTSCIQTHGEPGEQSSLHPGDWPIGGPEPSESGGKRINEPPTEKRTSAPSIPVVDDNAEVLDVDGRVLARREGPARVLMVEDDQDLADVLKETLRRARVQVEHATTASGAVALSRRFDPDMLLLDLLLPEGDSFQVVDWFRQHDRLRRVGVVVYTARDLTVREREQLGLGPTEFLTKARITPEQVRTRVLGLLDHVIQADQSAA